MRFRPPGELCGAQFLQSFLKHSNKVHRFDPISATELSDLQIVHAPVAGLHIADVSLPPPNCFGCSGLGKSSFFPKFPKQGNQLLMLGAVK